MYVWAIEADDYDSFVTDIADSVEAAVLAVKKPYIAPYLVKWDEPVKHDEERWSLTGHFTGVKGYCGTGPQTWNFNRFEVLTVGGGDPHE